MIYKTIAFLLIFRLTNTTAQTCKINYEYSSEELLKKNNIKEIKIYKGTDSSQKLFFHYFFSGSSCPNKLLHYDLYSKGTEPFVTEYNASANSFQNTFRKGRLINNRFIPYEVIEETFTASGKILKRVKTETVDFKVITQQKFDTTDHEKNFMKVIRILPNGGDTVSSILNSFDDSQRIYIFQKKTPGGWIEEEKLITSYAKDKIIKQERFKDGVLVETKHENDFSAQNNLELIQSKVQENPLPYYEYIKIDTSYSDTDKINLQVKNSKNKKSKFMIVRHSATNDVNKTERADVILQKNGLIQERIQSYRSESLRFEYIFN